MNLELPVQARIRMLDSQISQCSQDLITLPEGDLHIGRNGKYYTWKWKDAAGNWHYISKSNEEEAVQRALRKLYQAQLHDLAAEREACRRYAHYKERSVSKISRLMEKESPEFKRLLQKALTFPDDRVTAWENQSYQKSLVHPDALIHPTLKPDLFVRSKVEAMVSSSMTLTRIPHLYEKIIHIDRWEIAADFTALDIRTFREIPISCTVFLQSRQVSRHIAKNADTLRVNHRKYRSQSSHILHFSKVRGIYAKYFCRS